MLYQGREDHGHRHAADRVRPIRLLGNDFIGLWMGEQFKTGPVSLALLGFTQILAAPHYVFSSVLYGMSQHRSSRCCASSRPPRISR